MAPGVSCFVRVGDKIHETGKSSLFTDSVILVGRSNELGDKKRLGYLAHGRYGGAR
jgi:hypothetical protein